MTVYKYIYGSSLLVRTPLDATVVMEFHFPYTMHHQPRHITHGNVLLSLEEQRLSAKHKIISKHGCLSEILSTKIFNLPTAIMYFTLLCYKFSPSLNNVS